MFLHVEAERINLVCISVSFALLDVGECSIQQEGQSFYALSCITSPGGKHRGLAGSVAVLIAESLLMLRSHYNRSAKKSISYFALISSGGVTRFLCTDRDTCLLT